MKSWEVKVSETAISGMVKGQKVLQTKHKVMNVDWISRNKWTQMKRSLRTGHAGPQLGEAIELLRHSVPLHSPETRFSDP